MVDTLRNKSNTYFQKRNHIRLKKSEVTKKFILDAAVQRAAGLGKTIAEGTPGGANALANYAANGFTPEFVVDYVEELYFSGSTQTTFDAIHTFTRASEATFIDSTGTPQTAASGEPRIGHHVWDGSAWVNKGILIESEARTNLLLNTNTLSTQNVTVTNTAHTLHFTGTGTITLSGTSTAGPLVGTGTGEENRVSLTFTPTAGALTVTVSGTVTNAQLEAAATQSSYIPTAGAQVTRAAETLTIAAANLPYNSTAISIAMEGLMTYEDTDSNLEFRFLSWNDTNDERIRIDLSTAGSRTGQVTFFQFSGGVQDSVSSATNAYFSGINVPFSIASRHGATFINGAVDGAALTEDATPTAMPDVSAIDLDFAPDFMGVIVKGRMWGDDIGDTGIEEASS